MLFRLFKGYAKLALKIYCRKVIINHPEWLSAEGPLLLASNHPNSFLDGVILTTLFQQDIFTLARGDAFRNTWHNRILRWLHLLPVYRTSEGVENLEHNYTTFDICKKLFDQNGIVMIFSEGRCINEWHLRPLKKGTARLAISTWQAGINLTVVPVGFNYSPFRNFGKNVFINFGKPLEKDGILSSGSEGKMIVQFNEQLRSSLQPLVYEIDGNDEAKKAAMLYVPQPTLKRLALAVPALVGFMVHAPIYFTAKELCKKHFDNDHFDSAIVGLLVLSYPIFLLLVFIFAWLLFNWIAALAIVVLLPLCAWACVQLKPQLS